MTFQSGKFRDRRNELVQDLSGWIDTNRNLLMRVSVIALIFCASVIVAPQVGLGKSILPLGLFLGVVGVMGLIFLLRNPSLALVLMIPMAMVVPFKISTGTGTELNAAILLLMVLIGLWIFEMVVGRSFRLISSRSTISALALAASAILAFGFGQLPWFNAGNASFFAQIGGTMLFILSVGAFLVVGHQLTERHLCWVVWIFLGLSFFYIIARFTTDQNINFTLPLLNVFQSGAFGSVFWVWVLCLAFGQMVFNNRLAWMARVFLGVLIGLVWYVAFFLGRDWTSGWLPALAGLGIMVWLGFPKLRFPLILLGFVIAALGWNIIYGAYQSLVLTPDNIYSQMTRVEAWKILLRIFMENPIFGLGPANYYDYTPLFPILGYSVSFNSHSNYIDLLVETGIVGFVCFVWFMAEVFSLSLHLQNKVEEGFQKAFVIGAMGGVVGTVVAGIFGDWVIPFVYNVGFNGFRASMIAWLFMGGLVAVERFYKQKVKAAN